MRWGLLIAAVILAAALGFGNLDTVVSTWAAGRQTTQNPSLDLFGWPMLWWGRIGKGLQFLAGCAVVLDLIGVKRMRAAGFRAADMMHRSTEWTRRIRELNDLLHLKELVRHCLIFETRDAATFDGILPDPYWMVMESSECRIPDQNWFSHASLTGLRKEVLHALPAAHNCDAEHWRRLCEQQVGYVNSRVDAYVRSNVPPHELELLDHQEEVLLPRYNGRIAAVIACAVIAAAVTALSSLLWATGVTVLTAIGAFLFLVTSVVAPATAWTVEPVRVWLMIRSAAALGLSRMGVALLDRVLPGHRIRWFAFMLFVAGFLLDLLAS